MATKQKYNPEDAKSAYVDQGMSWAAASRATWPGVPIHNTAHCQKVLDAKYKAKFSRAVPADSAADIHVSETHTHQGNEWDISLPKTRIHTLEELLAYCKVDTSVWEVVRFTVNKWEMGSKDPDGSVTVTPLYQVKASLRKNILVADFKSSVLGIIEDLKRQAPAYPKITPRHPAGEHCLELDIFDLHMAKLAWSEETGFANYDCNIAEELFMEAVEELLARTSGYQVSRIIFPIGNDLFNADNPQGTTTSGTPQSMDSRHQKTFRRVVAMMRSAIDRMREVAPVDALIVPGNHDQQTTFYAGEVLAAVYEKAGDVSIDARPVLRKYITFGKNLIGFTHGDSKGGEKLADLPLTMAQEVPEEWGSTRYKEVHVGHWHKTRLDEYQGVRVRFLPSLCPPDAWHAKKAFTRNLRSAEALVWSRDRGLVGQHIFNIPD